MNERLAVEPILSRLRDFQRRTVEYVFQRMYLDADPARRFLVADEVGLGKTMVARGLIAKAISHLEEIVDRIDVVYICSNAAIARQNLNRLNVYKNNQFSFATRLTLLPVLLRELENNHVNFVSLTPGTTFAIKRGAGIKDERRVLYQMLRDKFRRTQTGLLNVLQGSVQKDRWRHYAELPIEIDRGLKKRFLRALWENRELLKELRRACRRHRRLRGLTLADWRLIDSLVGKLRGLLAGVCVSALEPDLIILDEFQRFKDLLDGNDEAAGLAQTLFQEKDARILLLSATPYKMLTLNHEREEDHYEDFRRTLEFLFATREAAASVEEDLGRFRHCLHGQAGGSEETDLVRSALENKLRSVMVRNERVPITQNADAMVEEPAVPVLLQSADLHQAVLTDRVARILKSWDAIEYWKSSPYLLNLMKEYELKNLLRTQLQAPSQELISTLEQAKGRLLRRRDFEHYREFEPANGRLRTLLQETTGSGQWKLLWVPPSLPYWVAGEAYADQQAMTKALVFSSWQVVPDAIAVACSYEAERAMVREGPEVPKYSTLKSRRGLLRFSSSGDERFAGMPALSLLYPSAALAHFIDPIEIALAVGRGRTPSLEQVKKQVGVRIARLLREAVGRQSVRRGRPDQRWYWAALALLDAKFAPWMGRWCTSHGPDSWRQLAPTSDDDATSGFAMHVEHFAEFFDGPRDLGKRPDDLLEVLAAIALGSPAVCALRSLKRVIGWIDLDETSLIGSAAKVAWGFRSLFDLPETMALLRADETREPYWRRVLDHTLAGNLPSVLDEYFHWLREAQGVMDHPAAEAVVEMAEVASDAVSVRAALLDVDELRVQPRNGTVRLEPFRVRCRFATRFSNLRSDDQEKLARTETVQKAFNSPFRPFVLATTSIGQEGLDFHPYCHRVYHWNLPSNPVDLEQREGRVHRYKGHAIRKNVAEKHGLAALSEEYRTGDDPWKILFQAAAGDRPEGTNELFPYWIYPEGKARVERRVLMLPFSREQQQLPDLKASLAVYRLVFGQPRQEDLLAHLKGRPPEQLLPWRISLAPPPRLDFATPPKVATSRGISGSSPLYCVRCGEAVGHTCKPRRGVTDLHWQAGDQVTFLFDSNGKGSQPAYRSAEVEAVNGSEARLKFNTAGATLRYQGGSSFRNRKTGEHCRLVSHRDMSGGAQTALVCPRCGAQRNHCCSRSAKPFKLKWQPGLRITVRYSSRLCAHLGVKPGIQEAWLVRASGSVARVQLLPSVADPRTIHLSLLRDGSWFDLDYGVSCRVEATPAPG